MGGSPTSRNSDDKLPDACFALPITALAASATYLHSAAPLSLCSVQLQLPFASPVVEYNHCLFYLFYATSFFHPPTRLSRGSGFSLRGRPGNLPQRPRRPFAVNTFIQLDSLDCPWWCPKVGTLCVIGIDVSLSPRGGAPRDALASPFAFISRSRAGPSLLCSASCCWLTSPLVTVNTAAGYACHP